MDHHFQGLIGRFGGQIKTKRVEKGLPVPSKGVLRIIVDHLESRLRQTLQATNQGFNSLNTGDTLHI